MFVQFQKNSAYHSGAKRSPYSVSFGEEARVGITAFYLPQEVLSKPDSEEDLLAVIMDQPSILVYISSSDPAASVSSVPAHSVSSGPAPPFPVFPLHQFPLFQSPLFPWVPVL